MAPNNAFDLDSLHTSISLIFDQVQSSVATHKKNCATLYRLHSNAASVVETIMGRKDTVVKLVGEKVFTELLVDMINRILVVKKGPPAPDKVVRFVGTYFKFLKEKVLSGEQPGSMLGDTDDDIPATRFVTRLLKHLIDGFHSKNKIVRYRVVSLLSEIVGNLAEIDEDLYMMLRSGLLERLQDKEFLIRSYAAISLSKLAASEDPQELSDDEQPIITFLIDSLCYDPSAEVRRAVLLHIPLIPITLPALLTRTRDIDAVTRKLVYTSVLNKLTHPKQLTIAQRELVVRQGLGDREEAVRLAAAKVITAWLDLYEGNIVEFLDVLDVFNEQVVIDVLKSIFVMRPEILDEVEFDEPFWTDLRPESALLARVFVQYCVDTKNETKLEASLPVVTALAFHIQAQYNNLLELMHNAEAEKLQDSEGEERLASLEDGTTVAVFVIEELLRLSVHLDFADEIGRRKMFGLVREMIAHAALPITLIKPCLAVLDVLSSSERDLIRLVVEVINELRDPQGVQQAEDSLTDANQSNSTIQTFRTPERRVQKTQNMSTNEEKQSDVMTLRCLDLCVAILEKVNGTFEDNSTLKGILGDLIIPAVERKELALREKGLVSLGLCCLIARSMAVNAFQLFLNQLRSASDVLKLKVLQIIFDVLITYEHDFLGRPDGQQIVAFLMQILDAEESKPIQAILCLGLSKLMLFGLVTDARILASLVLAYVSPFTTDNQELRQCLAYFLPVYCYSSAKNQSQMQSIFITVYDLAVGMFEDLDDDSIMITPMHFGQLFVDWTDPQKMINFSPEPENDDAASQQVHVDLAIDILKALYDSDRNSDNKRTLCQLLNMLYLPAEAEEHALYTLYILVLNLQEQCPFEEPALDSLFMRFKTRLARHFSAQLKEFDEQVCFREQEFQALFDFIGVTAPFRHRETELSDEEQSTSPTSIKRKDQHRRLSQRHADQISDVKSESDVDSAESRPPTPSPLAPKNGKRKGKERATIPASPPMPAKQKRVNVETVDQLKENQPQPSTPTRKKSTKRVRSPSQAKNLRSPAHKRSRRGTATTSTRTTRSGTVSEAPPPRIKPRAAGRASKQRATVSVSTRVRQDEVEDDEADDDSSASDVQVPYSEPKFIEEKIGWDGSDDL